MTATLKPFKGGVKLFSLFSLLPLQSTSKSVQFCWWIPWRSGPTPPKVPLVEFGDREGDTLMIPRQFVGMAHMEDSWFRTDGTGGANSTLTMYRVYERWPLYSNRNWNDVLHGGFVLRWGWARTSWPPPDSRMASVITLFFYAHFSLVFSTLSSTHSFTSSTFLVLSSLST